VIRPRSSNDYDVAAPVIQGLVGKGAWFVAVSGLGLLSPGDTGQLNDGGPSAAHTAIGIRGRRTKCMYFKAVATRRTTFRTCSAAWAASAVLLDGGGPSATVLRRDTGGMWAGAGAPKGNCGTRQVLCDSHERALPSWLAFN
jgi:hypothetical protein